MVSVFTANKRIEEPAFNDFVDSWHTPVNANWTIIDKALGSSTLLNATGQSGGINITLTPAQYQSLSLLISGAPGTGGAVYCIPSGVGGQWVVRNDTTGGQPIALRSLAGGAILPILAGNSMLLSCDGTASGMRYSQTASAVLNAAGSATQVQYNNGGVLAGSANLTFDGTTVTAVGLATTGNTTLGNGSTDILTVTGNAVTAANGLNFNTGQLVLLTGAAEQVAIGTTVPGPEKFTVQGSVKISGSGSALVFPDGSSQVTAGIISGSIKAAGPIRSIQYNADGAAGTFGGEAGFAYDPAINTADIPNLRLGAALPIVYGGTGGTTSTGVGGTGVVLRQSPDLTGVPTAPTAAAGANSQQIATTAFVRSEASNAAGRVLATGHFQVSGGAIGASKLTGATVAYVSAGRYRVTLSTAAPDSDYTVLVTAAGAFGGTYGFEVAAVARTTSVFEIGSGGISVAYADPAYMNFTVHV